LVTLHQLLVVAFHFRQVVAAAVVRGVVLDKV
jgi:hypothetical protein